jgi:branched-chain amino acid transport system substrate-binding protein
LPIRQITGSLAEDLEKALSAKGMKAVTVEKFNIKDVDMTPQLLKAKQPGAQAVLTYGIGPELAQIANGMEKLNWKVPMIGSWTRRWQISWITQGKWKWRDDAANIYTGSEYSKRKAFIEAYQKAYKVERIPSPVSAAQGYDSSICLLRQFDRLNY